MIGEGCYFKNDKFMKHINKKDINLIFEIGSRDCLDAIDLYKYFDCKVYAFECNPDAIKICKKNLKQYNIENNQVQLVKKAVYNENKTISFYPVSKTKNVYEETKQLFKINGNLANIGASSIFKFNKDFEKDKYGHIDHHEQNNKINVNAIKLDDFISENSIDKIDLICMDLQGAEYMALQGLEKNLKNVKYIITELHTTLCYENQSNINDVINLLSKYNFKLIEGNINKKYSDDFLFININ